MSGGGKGEIEAKLDAFVKESFERFGLDIASQSMSKKNAQTLIHDLMKEFGHENAWDEEEFNRTFDLFQEDDGGEDGVEVDPELGGLDKDEFTKLVSRMAQL